MTSFYVRSVTIDIDNRKLNDPNGFIGDWLQDKARELVFLSKASVGVDTGNLQRSIEATRVTNPVRDVLEVKVGANPRLMDTGYGVLYHEGTRPHLIVPRNGEWLYFRVRGGRLVRARQVWHPGTRPTLYLVRWLRRLFN